MGIRKILEYFGSGFSRRWAWKMASTLMFTLDPTTIIGIVWYFGFSGRYPVDPAVLTGISIVYLVLTVVLILLSFVYGKFRSIQTTGMFYLSVGFFFLLRGLLGGTGTDFSSWPWIIVWVAILVLVFSHFRKELEELDPSE